ncbi:unnamed protein product [Ectocarpus sp. 12 AP-2014]
MQCVGNEVKIQRQLVAHATTVDLNRADGAAPSYMRVFRKDFRSNKLVPALKVTATHIEKLRLLICEALLAGHRNSPHPFEGKASILQSNKCKQYTAVRRNQTGPTEKMGKILGFVWFGECAEDTSLPAAAARCRHRAPATGALSAPVYLRKFFCNNTSYPLSCRCCWLKAQSTSRGHHSRNMVFAADKFVDIAHLRKLSHLAQGPHIDHLSVVHSPYALSLARSSCDV